MTLLHADFLYYGAILFGIALILVIRDGKVRSGILRAILGERAKDPAFVRLSRGRRALRFVLIFAALALAVLTAARPAWGTETIDIAGRGRDVLVLFDVSKSMLAGDVAPSRLEHAKYFLSQLVKQAKDDRFALISFAGNAFLECPFTADKVSFLQYVNELSTDSIPLGGTDLERALQTAAQAFRAAETPNKAIVLLTDGEELSGSAERTFTLLKSVGVPLFVVGIGDPSVPALIPLPNRQYLHDRKGELVRSKLNEPLLRRIAETSGGLYFNSTAADSRLAAVAGAIDSREKGLWDKGGSARMIEHPEWFLGIAAFLLLLALLLPERSRAKALLLLLCLNCVMLCGAEPQKTGKQDPVSLYNTARAQQLAADPSFAAGYETVLKDSREPDLTARAFHNLAVSRQQEAETALQKARTEVQQQQLDPALKTLEQAISCCDGAKELYRQSLARNNAIPAQTSGGNLQRLSDDRAAIEELKKKIEELKKQQQKAQQQTQKAKDENQQQKKNSSQDQKKNQKKDKDQRSGSKDQSGKSELDKAQQEVKDLQKKAEDLQQKQQSEQAKQAQSELEKAQQAQQKQDRRSAEKHIEEALKKLGGGASPQSPKDQQKKKEDDQKQNSASPQEQKQPQKAPAPAGAGKKDEKENAAKMVELLSGEEKDLRDALKAQMLQNSRSREVEKDW